MLLLERSSFWRDPYDAASVLAAQMLLETGNQIARRTRGLVLPQEAGVAGKYGVDTGEIARSGNLRVFEGQEFVVEGGGKDFFRQGQNVEKPHQLSRNLPLALVSAGTGRRAVVADHAEGGCADIAVHGIGFSESQGARRRIGIGPLQEDIEKDVGVEQHAQTFTAPKSGAKIRRHRAVSVAALPTPER